MTSIAGEIGCTAEAQNRQHLQRLIHDRDRPQRLFVRISRPQPTQQNKPYL
jgi:hypothetical protein